MKKSLEYYLTSGGNQRASVELLVECADNSGQRVKSTKHGDASALNIYALSEVLGRGVLLKDTSLSGLYKDHMHIAYVECGEFRVGIHWLAH
jgi:hypothetical protein